MSYEDDKRQRDAQEAERRRQQDMQQAEWQRRQQQEFWDRQDGKR